MRSNPVLVVLSVVLWLSMSSSPAVAQSTPQQPPKKAAAAQSAPLTPQEREAQKHYRVALEAIKNNDFSTAADELKAASGLAPKNALIWYNLAVVESKKGDAKSALEHLQKAESLGLPKSMQNDADDLEAKLTYKTEIKARAAAAQPEKAPAAAADTGPALSESLEFLSRILPANEAHGNRRRSWSNTYSQDQFLIDPNSCSFSWDEVETMHPQPGSLASQYGDTVMRYRELVSLKHVLLSDVKVMDFMSLAMSPAGVTYLNGLVGTDSCLGCSFAGYVLATKQTVHGDTSPPTPDGKFPPTPDRVDGIMHHFPNEVFFFSSVDDANRARNAFVRAATLCGAQPDEYSSVAASSQSVQQAKVNVSGSWRGGHYTLTQHGDIVISEGDFGHAYGRFTGPYTFTMTWASATFDAKVSPDGSRIDWSNNTTWARDGGQ
jgi:hypothetical protein